MYNEKLAVAVKSAGKVLREFKDTVFVPFGNEYSILVKNLNTVRALVKVSIDGEYVDETGEGFVIGANSDIELERFLKNGNLNKGNRFKFIERNAKVEQSRGIELEDGLIRIEFQYEKVLPKIEEVHHYTKHIYHNDYPYWYHHRYLGGPVYGSSGWQSFSDPNTLLGQADSLTTRSLRGSSCSNAPVQMSNTVASACFASNAASPAESYTVTSTSNEALNSLINDAGITVPGSVSDQRFVKVSGFPLQETTHVVVLKLLGETENGKKVVQAVTVKSKQKCTTCGHLNKATAKYCSECGTGLEIV